MSHRLPLGSGSPEGTNSAWLLPDRGVLVDPGPTGEEPWTALTDGLAALDYPLADIDHVVVTHWHGDHIGAAPRLAERADATVHMHRLDAPLLADYAVAREERVARDAATLARWGAPDDVVAHVRERDRPAPLPDATPVVAHEDGDTVAGATVVHTPGHTAGHLALATDDELFVGDTLLTRYTPNVGGSDTRMTDPLTDYLDSLDRLLAHGGAVRPGHGTTIDGPARAATIRDHHRERSGRVAASLAAHGEATPWTVAVDLFGDLRGVHAKFGPGETAAHLAYLARGGSVTVVREEPLTYRAVEPLPDDATLPSF